MDELNCKLSHILFILTAALIPDAVQNLNTDVDMNVPSVTLKWDPPPNVGTGTQSSWTDVSKYHIRFRPECGEHYNEITVDGSTTSIVLRRESGIIPQTISVFEVRAQSGDSLGQWKKSSRYIGKHVIIVLYHELSNF